MRLSRGGAPLDNDSALLADCGISADGPNTLQMHVSFADAEREAPTG